MIDANISIKEQAPMRATDFGKHFVCKLLIIGEVQEFLLTASDPTKVLESATVKMELSEGILPSPINI